MSTTKASHSLSARDNRKLTSVLRELNRLSVLNLQPCTLLRLSKLALYTAHQRHLQDETLPGRSVLPPQHVFAGTLPQLECGSDKPMRHVKQVALVPAMPNEVRDLHHSRIAYWARYSSDTVACLC